jgi:hypothetical protein
MFGCEFLKVVGKLLAKVQTQNSYPDARVSELLDGRRRRQSFVIRLERDEQGTN